MTTTPLPSDFAPAEQHPDDGRRPIRALVVDDESSLSELVTLTLQLEGWSVHSAADGRAALAAARIFEPDIVILDMMLPDMNGLAILRELRRENPRLPVVFLTARDGADERTEGLEAGADDYLTKPFSLAELLERLLAVLSRVDRDIVSTPPNLANGDLVLPEDAHSGRRHNTPRFNW